MVRPFRKTAGLLGDHHWAHPMFAPTRKNMGMVRLAHPGPCVRKKISRDSGHSCALRSGLVILAAQEAEAGGSQVQSQTGQLRRLPQKKKLKRDSSVVSHLPRMSKVFALSPVPTGNKPLALLLHSLLSTSRWLHVFVLCGVCVLYLSVCTCVYACGCQSCLPLLLLIFLFETRCLTQRRAHKFGWVRYPEGSRNPPVSVSAIASQFWAYRCAPSCPEFTWS